MKFRVLASALLAAGSIAAAANRPAAAPKSSVAVKDMEALLEGRWVEGDQEILAYRAKGAFSSIDVRSRVTVVQPEGRPRPWSAVYWDGEVGMIVLVRRQIPPAQERQEVVVDGRTDDGERPGPSRRFVIGDAAQAPIDRGLKRLWLRSFRDGLDSGHGSWFEFAKLRTDEVLRIEESRAGGKGKKEVAPGRTVAVAPRRRANASSLADLMDMATGMASLRETLQADRVLRGLVAGEAATIPITSLQAPSPKEHPWRAMIAALDRKQPDEPLAKAAPARFYYLRFASLAHLFRTLDEADAWMTPALSIHSGLMQNQELGRRYEAQLGLARTLVSRALGPQVVTDLAVVGSDPYLREGSDLTFIFRVKSQPVFMAGLASSLAAHQEAHGKLSTQTIEHAGHTITLTRSEDGAVRQHVVQVGGFTIVSNSLGATKVVLDTLAGRAPALAAELDFQYMMARDAAVPADVLAFMGDAFVAGVIGPGQKVLEARRLLAAYDLLVPGYAALLFGHMAGRAPRTTAELLASGLLTKDELKHAGGEVLGWTPSGAVRSSWGTVAAMTPLIDLPAPTAVTATERDAYHLFAQSYGRNWSSYIDPACLRIRFDAASKGGLRADLRVLPIIDASDYRKVQTSVGDARVEVPALASGATVTLGVGPRAELRNLVAELTRTVPLPLRAQLDWLGEVAFLGFDDRLDSKTILEVANRNGGLGGQDLAKLLVESPIHAGVTVRNRLAAAGTLAAIRSMLERVAPGSLEWSGKGKARGIPYVAIGARGRGEMHALAGDLRLYYAFCKDNLLLSLSEATLKARIVDCSDGKLARPAGPGKVAGPQSPQLVFSLSMKKGGPIWQLLGAGASHALDEAEHSSRWQADAVTRGTPGAVEADRSRISLAYFGSIPTDASGAPLLAQPKDASEGRAQEPMLRPARDDSIVGSLLKVFARARSEIAFDREVEAAGAPQPIQSLHVTLSLDGER